MSIERKDIRGVTISVTGGRLLLPNANIAEIITFAEPEALPEAPDWVLGRLRWRGLFYLMRALYFVVSTLACLRCHHLWHSHLESRHPVRILPICL